MKNIYTGEQIEAFAKKTEIFPNMQDVLELLEETAEMNMKEIGNKLEISSYQRDKAMIALEFAGFIDKKEVSVTKVYFITEQGKKLIEEIGRIKG